VTLFGHARPAGARAALTGVTGTLAATLLGLGLLLPTTALAQKMTGSPATAGYKQTPGEPSASMPQALREIGFDQNIGHKIPLDTKFRDESGATVRLGDYFGQRPVVLVFAYYSCPMLCGQITNGLAGAMDLIRLESGKDFEVVVVSFDPKDTPQGAREKKAQYLHRYGRPEAASSTHFLSGDESQIRQLTSAAGFRYAWDADTQQYAHPSGVITLTPDGTLARYMFGIEYGPRDLRFGIIEASNGKTGTAVDNLLLYCYHYDPMTGRYGLVIMRTLRVAGVGTLLALGTFIVVMVRNERRRR